MRFFTHFMPTRSRSTRYVSIGHEHASFAPMKVLVTGATGFLGSHVAEALKHTGHTPIALVRRSSNVSWLRENGVATVVGSLETGEGLQQAMVGMDAVVHAAGLVKAKSPDEFHLVNVVGTERILQAALAQRQHIKRFVYISSLAAHGPSPDGAPRNADAAPQPVTHYGRSKLAGELAVLAQKDVIPVSILRPPAIYGPRDREMFAFFQSVNRRIVPLMGTGHRASVIYAPDCAAAVVKMLTQGHPSGRAYFIEDGQTYTWEDMGNHLQAALQKQALSVQIPFTIFRAAAGLTEFYGRVRDRAVMLTRDKLNELSEKYWVCSAEPLRQDLGWTPTVDFKEGARLTATWYRQNGWL